MKSLFAIAAMLLVTGVQGQERTDKRLPSTGKPGPVQAADEMEKFREAIAAKGKALYEQARIARASLAAAEAEGRLKENIDFQLPVQADGHWTILMGHCGGDPARATVSLVARPPAPPADLGSAGWSVQAYLTPTPLAKSEQAALSALLTARAAFSGEAGVEYRALLLRRADKGFDVTVCPELGDAPFLLGTDREYRISADGKKILSTTLLHERLYRIEEPPDNARGLVHRHLEHALPAPTDILFALEHLGVGPFVAVAGGDPYVVTPAGDLIPSAHPAGKAAATKAP